MPTDNKAPEEISFGEWLHQRRRMLDLTQQALADQVGCARITLRRIESGALKPSKELALILLEKLGIPEPERSKWILFARGNWEAAPEAVKEDASGIATHIREYEDDMSNPKIHLASFIFTDIEDSAKLWENAPKQMKVALGRHHAILQEAISSSGGTVFQIVGDAFCAAFPTPPSAISAAVTAQRGLHQEEWGLPFPIRVRMGIHTGEAEPISNDSPTGGYASNRTLNRVARILDAAHGGQILLSLVSKELVADSLPENTELRDMGEHYLKNLIRPEHLFQLTIAGLPSDFPPLNTLGSARHNLPVQLTSFIGREKELDEITKLIAKNRLVTLTGAGGIGKTRLSIQVASALLNDHPNGTWLIELAPLSDPALVPQAIVTTLGLIEQADLSPLRILTDFLQTKQALVVLDNCEHLIQACAQLAEILLHSSPDLHILTTSREALGIAGETLYLVPPLTTPDPAYVTLEALPDYEAVKLFVERAQSALAGFMLTHENAPATAQVCRQLDGIPLALELAAARIKMMSVEQIASHLNDRFHLLTGGARTALPRHQTLQAMIDWSHDLLSKPERVLLRRLSIFAGGWTLEAAESVCRDEGIEKYEILDLLTQLLNKSLVLAERKQGQETRYRMLETIRQYASKKLWEAGEGEILRQRHLGYFVEFAERAEPNLRAFDMVIWLNRLEAELDNVRVALEWAQESDAVAQLRLVSALLWFWHIRSHKNEGIDWLERGLSIEAAERGAEPLTPSHAMIRGKALNATGILRGESLVGKAAEYFEESLNLFKKLGPAGKQGLAYAFLGLAGWTGQMRGMTTKDLPEHCLSLFREVGDKFGAAQCLMSIAGYARVKGDLERARVIGEEHLALRKEIGDKDGIAIAQAHLGLTVWRQGDAQQARELYEESLAGFREVGNIYFVGHALSLLSDIAQEQSNHEQATKLLQEGLTLAQSVGNMTMMAQRFNDLGKLAWAQGNYKLAAKRFNEELIMCQEAGNKFGTSSALHGLGRVAQSQEDYLAARSLYTESIVLGQEISNSWIVTINLSAFATLAAAQKKPEQAARLAGAAETQIPSIRFEMSAKERAEHDQAVAAARTAPSEEAFMAAYDEGKKMSLDEAVSYALKED